MARSPIRTSEILKPQRVLGNIINDYITGRLDSNNFLYRVLVVKVDYVGGKLEGPDSETRKNEPSNPKNSIQARIVTDGIDRATPEEDLPVFWPFFPFDGMPIKEGEHAYVVFEDNSNKSHGLWLTRIPENNKIDQLNLVPGDKKYQENDANDTSSVALSKAAQDTELEAKQPKQSDDFAKEEIPPFTPRVGDRTIQGSNNTLISLSRDRIDEPSSGIKSESGTIFLVAGRKDKENLNLKDDKAFIIISSKTDVDKNLSIKAGDEKSGVSTVAIKADEIRISARKGMKIVVDSGDVYIKNDGKLNIESSGEVNVKSGKKIVLDCSSIEVGGGGEKAVLGDTLKGLIDDYVGSNTTHTHPSAMGPTGPSVDLVSAKIQASIKLAQILSNTVKVKA